jgi:hypothetical protein
MDRLDLNQECENDSRYQISVENPKFNNIPYFCQIVFEVPTFKVKLFGFVLLIQVVQTEILCTEYYEQVRG